MNYYHHNCAKIHGMVIYILLVQEFFLGACYGVTGRAFWKERDCSSLNRTSALPPLVSTARPCRFILPTLNPKVSLNGDFMEFHWY
jgi:hypothetical protein